MTMVNWRDAVQPHADIAAGTINESFYAADLGEAVRGEGPAEYSDPALFFRKTHLTEGLRLLLGTVLKRISGDREENGIVMLQTSFGGGKTHSELAVYHLLSNSDASTSVSDIDELVRAAGMASVPTCKVAVLPGTSLDPLGRTTDDGIRIRTWWGEMAYQLGGAEAFALVADNDAKLGSPGSENLIALLKHVGPSVILMDEVLHYVDKAWQIDGPEKALASHTVAFVRELTDAVSGQNAAMVVSLTASAHEQLSDRGHEWLTSLSEQVLREAAKRTPVERKEIHSVVRRRLFEEVDSSAASAAAKGYRTLLADLQGLSGHHVSSEYQQVLEHSYPFHPELVDILYTRWASRPGFQLTRDTLRFLSFVLQSLWSDPSTAQAPFIQTLDVDFSIPNLRGMAREVSGDPEWESVIGTDVSTRTDGAPAHAQLLDRERGDERCLHEGLATTILLYSLGGGEEPQATRERLRLSCSRPDVPEAAWNDMLAQFERTLHYYYWDDASYRFRKVPNVVSLQYTYKYNLEDAEVQAYLATTLDKSLGASAAGHGFEVQVSPDSQQVDDDPGLKLVVLSPSAGGQVTERAVTDDLRRYCLEIVSKRGDIVRVSRNTILFCAPDADALSEARREATEYLAWRKVQANSADWDRIGGSQQHLVNDRLEGLRGSSYQALISAYRWVVAPKAASGSADVSLELVNVGNFGPGTLLAPTLWDRLTQQGGDTQRILTGIAPAELRDRYGADTGLSQKMLVTTAELRDRFVQSLSLPRLSSEDVLVEALRAGEKDGLWALGQLTEDDAPRDSRQSYVALYCREPITRPSEPAIGRRWLVIGTELYDQLQNAPRRVTAEDVKRAMDQLGGSGQPVPVKAIKNYLAGDRGKVAQQSLVAGLLQVASSSGLAFRSTPEADDRALPSDPAELLGGHVIIATEPPPKLKGREVVISGTLQVTAIPTLWKNVIQPLMSQNPDAMQVDVTLRARYEQDPGAGLTAALADGIDKEAFPGLSLADTVGE